MSKVNLETFAGGALQEKFDETFERVSISHRMKSVPIQALKYL